MSTHFRDIDMLTSYHSKRCMRQQQQKELGQTAPHWQVWQKKPRLIFGDTGDPAQLLVKSGCAATCRSCMFAILLP